MRIVQIVYYLSNNYALMELNQKSLLVVPKNYPCLEQRNGIVWALQWRISYLEFSKENLRELQ
jgi:hypothetical protein